MKKANQVRLTKMVKGKNPFIGNIQFLVPYNLEGNGNAQGIYFLKKSPEPLLAQNFWQ
jgi:hypothetical protein